MASPSMSSPWAIPQHGVDHNGYVASASMVGDNSFDSTQSRKRRGSSPGKRALNWFSRSRSNSPQTMEPSSPTSFVVRNVVKRPGGVSQDSYYCQVKSQPLTGTSLGVPPGGPGGGVGYGTASSSNDGRPEEHTRGRSPSPTRPPSPGAITAGAFRSGRISPGPLSWSQARTMEEKEKRGASQERSAASPHRTANVPASPSGPRVGSFAQQPQRGNTSPLSSSPLAGSVLAPTLSTISVNANGHPSQFSMPVHLPPGSGPPPIIPLEGVPSPIDIPSSPAQAGITPLGSVSPAGSPGQFFGMGTHDRQAKASPGGSPNFASRWMKGIFSKSPRQEERDDAMYVGTSSEGQWMKPSSSPNAPYASKNFHNAWSDGSPLPGLRSPDEIEAEARKKHSMHMAARIEDHHRGQVIQRQEAAVKKLWTPRQAIDEAEQSDWDPPQSKSPPGRKPVPKYSAQELCEMPESQRQNVAQQVDPDDRLSKLEGSLTPAQQIIAQTRSKQLAREHQAGDVSRDATEADRRASTETRAPTLPSKSPQPSMRRDEKDDDTPVRRGSKKQAPVQTAIAPPIGATRSPTAGPSTAKPTAAGLTAGNGPMPKEMNIGEALQEMMVRFYRFERYAVPLMRSMEARIVDVERDNQMALHGDAMSANSARDREMDKWVGQMTGVMRHEIGQLKAATREIREGREMLSHLAKVQNAPSPSGFLSQRAGEPIGNAENTCNTQSQLLPRSKSEELNEEGDKVGEMKGKVVAEHNRRTNFSSSTFNSAVPRKPNLDILTAEPVNMMIREASVGAANVRPRYTNTLGQPMQDGKISPAASPTKEKPPPLSDHSAFPAGHGPARRMQSLDDRLKALVVDKIRSPSVTSSSTQASGQSASLHEEDENNDEESDNTSFEKIPSQQIDKDYQVIMARGDSKASARSASDGSSGPVEKLPASQHLQTPSTMSKMTDVTVRQPARCSSARSSNSSSGGGFNSTSPSPNASRLRTTSAAALSSASAIKTSSHASNGLRARAQSYLQNADGGSRPSSSPPSPAPTHSPVSARSPLQSPALADVPPLRPYKSANAMQTKSAVGEAFLGSNAPTLRSSNSSGSPTKGGLATSVNTPGKLSIRDRVAFFDAPK